MHWWVLGPLVARVAVGPFTPANTQSVAGPAGPLRLEADLNEELAIAIEAARAGGAEIRKALGRSRRPTEVRHKGAIDLVTEVDLASEAAVVSVLERRSPGVPVLTEEAGGAWESTTRWLVDPLDGTTNFAHGFSIFAVSIALQQKGQLVAGCIYDPTHDICYTAARGQGAHQDGVPIRVSDTHQIDQSILLTGFPYDRRERVDVYLAPLRAFLLKCQGIRRCGAAALDFVRVATGQADGFWEFGLSPWDVAAGMLLVEEAGGRVSDMDLGPLDLNRATLLATNGRIHEEMAAVLAPFLSSS